MKTFLMTVLSVSFLMSLVTGCGGESREEKLSNMVGVYEGNTQAMKSAGGDYFVITPDGSLYLLANKTQGFNRDYKGETSKMDFDFDDGVFSSGNVSGKKVDENSNLPPAIARLAKINSRAARLSPTLKAQGIELEVRLEQSYLAFSDDQVSVLDELLTRAEPFASHLKSQGLSAFWVNDYSNGFVYTRSGRLNLPSGISGPATDVTNSLFAKSYVSY